jgi:TonB-dependent SusC/RagA subfamily outer membrane receptor
MKHKSSLRFIGALAKLHVLLLFFLLISFAVNSQTITGKVSDEKGLPLQSVSVMVKGTKTGTTTDAAGQYSIKAESTATLIFSSVGYASIELAVSNRSIVDAVLPASLENLGEVVVTALGIRRTDRSLGYSTTSVKPEELTVNRTANPMNALQGKVAGVNITQLGTGPAGTSKIRIRGQSALTGGGSPLIVINGVPIDNSNFNNNTVGVTGGGVYADGGDGLASINPDDIENMTILKGAPAAALYGSRAANGVIMITTKTKGVSKGIWCYFQF